MTEYVAEPLMARIETQLDTVLQLPNVPVQLVEAMRYACLNGGKRLRAQLVYATGQLFTNHLAQLDTAACAVELIHAYSLVHDDLPAMDDDDLRRGKPTVHKAFDEATAILVGDALQTLAFDCLAQRTAYHCAETQLRMIQILAQASGAAGMVAGQHLDLQAMHKTLTEGEVAHIHQAKTGALMKASILLGALAGGCQDADVEARLSQFADHIGFAFQVQDDILDLEASSATLGKTAGKDAAQHKATYPSVTSLDKAKLMVQSHFALAQSLLQTLADSEQLGALTQFILKRQF